MQKIKTLTLTALKIAVDWRERRGKWHGSPLSVSLNVIWLAGEDMSFIRGPRGRLLSDMRACVWILVRALKSRPRRIAFAYGRERKEEDEEENMFLRSWTLLIDWWTNGWSNRTDPSILLVNGNTYNIYALSVSAKLTLL